MNRLRCTFTLDKVYCLYCKYKDQEIIPLVLMTLYKILRHVYWLIDSGRGLPHTTDSNWYIAYANAITHNLTNGLDVNDVLYFGYNVLLALLLAVCKDPVFIVFIQAVAAGFSVILIYKIAYMLFDRTTAVLASLIYCFTYEFTLWSLYILSDSFFVDLLLLCVYFLLMAFESGKKAYKALFVAAALYMLVFRPTGVISLIFILAYILIRLDRHIITGFLKKHALIAGSVLATAAGVCICLYIDNKFALLAGSLQYEIKKVLYNVYAKGWIYDISTAYNYFFVPDYTVNVLNSLALSFIVNNWDHVSILYGRRALAFLGTWVWKHDLASIPGILAFVQSMIPSAVFLAGTIAAITNQKFRKASILWLMVLAVFIFCVLLFIDAMYRYRFPALPFIIIISAYGAARIICRVLGFLKTGMGMMLYGKRKNAGCNPGL